MLLNQVPQTGHPKTLTCDPTVLWSEVPHWLLCLGSYEVKCKVLTGLGSFLEAAWKNLPPNASLLLAVVGLRSPVP